MDRKVFRLFLVVASYMAFLYLTDIAFDMFERCLRVTLFYLAQYLKTECRLLFCLIIFLRQASSTCWFMILTGRQEGFRGVLRLK